MIDEAQGKPESPYRESSAKEPLRDTGRERKIPDETEHMSGARAFDTLVSSNLALVKTLRTTIIVLVSFGLIATSMTAFSAVILRMGQTETRELIIAISTKKGCP